MSKTRKILATLTMVAVTATASFSAVSSAQAHVSPWPHSHTVIATPGVLGALPGIVIPPGLLLPVPPVHNHASHHHHSSHNHGLNSGQAAALGLFGGLVIGALASRRQQAPAPAAALPAAHYAYCDAKYRSYVIVTNTFTGYDGRQHYCMSPYI